MPIEPWMIDAYYAEGAFPMGEDDGEVKWYRPYERAVFPIEGIRVSRSMHRFLASHPYTIRFNTAFERVMRSCRRPDENWINEPIIEVFCELHRLGRAHCGEVWEGDELVGGIYGVALGTCFSAESMFHRRTNASKLALWALVHACREAGFEIFDAQIMNPHLESLGAVSMPMPEFLERLGRCMRKRSPQFPRRV